MESLYVRLAGPHRDGSDVVCIYVHVLYIQPMEVAVRRLNEMGVFCVFVILDSLSKVCRPTVLLLL